MEETNAAPSQVPSSATSSAEGAVGIGIATDSKARKSIIDEAKDAAAELREQNMLRLEILKKEEELVARREALRELGGDSSAGQKPIKKEETPQEYRDRVMKNL